jgi:hypothetical protein
LRPLAALRAALNAAQPRGARPSVYDWTHQHAILRTADGVTLRYHDVARDYQDAILTDAARRLIIAKSRQIGISQTVAFLAAYEARYGGTVLVISRDQDQAAEFLAYVRTALDGDETAPARVGDNKYSLTLANGGRVVTQAATAKAGRGTPATLVIIDEMAWQEYADLIYTAVLPTLATTAGRLVVMSTPQGRANRFYQLWQQAQDGASGWSAHFLPWSVHPDWDEAWAEEQRAVLGDAAFAQEHDVDFAVSGLAVFEPADIAALWRLPAFVAPEPNHRYVTAWDIARKRDAFVGFTFDVSTAPFRVVAYERHVRLDYPQQAARIEARHRRYSGQDETGRVVMSCCHTTIVESNGVGDPLIQFLSVRVEEFVTTAKTKRNAIDALRLLLSRR